MTPNLSDQPRVSRWLVPLVSVGIGGVILVARAIEDDLTGGLVWFAIFAAVGALSAVAGEHAEDEREAAINTRAMAAAGLVLTVTLTGCIVFELARGESPNRTPG